MGIEKVLIVSDTHGRLRNYETVLKKSGPFDLVIHLGDLEGGESIIRRMTPCPLEMISGNNDYMTDLMKEKEIEIGKYRIFMTHGHRYHVHYGYGLLADEARKRGCRIAMCGHTHVPAIEYFPDVTVINPGSLTLPRPMSKDPSYILMDFDREGEVHFTVNRLTAWG